ncbi:hypothetical protein [uncultured Coprobacter sp.]|uniref:hypothetical protein n=1 Tax=Coprobacter sp. TaxID=1941478 RepID=UPI00260D8865|nr:hypothetical protein [uncultured Coprobacter sp.]
MKYLEIIEKLHPDIIHHFLSTGECQGIPVEVQRFLKQMQWAAEIYEYERNITRAAGMLRSRIKAQQGLDVDVRTCKSRIYSAINYFSIDNNVSVKVWENDFADKYEDLALLAIDAGEYKTAKACKDAALECRRRACEAAEKDSAWAPVFIISPEITPEELGFSKRSLKEIARKSNEGFYINLIESLPIENDEKKRLLSDANIQEAEFTEELNDE